MTWTDVFIGVKIRNPEHIDEFHILSRQHWQIWHTEVCTQNGWSHRRGLPEFGWFISRTEIQNCMTTQIVHEDIKTDMFIGAKIRGLTRIILRVHKLEWSVQTKQKYLTWTYIKGLITRYEIIHVSMRHPKLSFTALKKQVLRTDMFIGARIREIKLRTYWWTPHVYPDKIDKSDMSVHTKQRDSPA